MAEKLPSPPLTGIATKIVGESPDVSLEEKVIQKNYEKLVDDLDVQSSVDLFYGRELITSDTMERINNATTRKGANRKDVNRVLINDLLKGISPDRFSKFVSLLRESADQYKRPHHKTVADKLEGDLKANPNPFSPPQFPPTGSPAGQGPPSQPLLGPPPGMPLSMALQVPGAFPPGMGVPSGFRSQPMSVSQPFWGIPPTSTVSLAPSVSTEQGPLDSPLVHRLRDHLYRRYKTFKVGGGGKKMEFVRLAVLKGQVNVLKDEEEIRDKLAFLQKFRNCGKEERQIAGYIDAFDLLHKSNHRIRVVYGQPGIGKTTLLTHVCRALAMKEADSEYTLVLYFPLRNKTVSGAKTLSELLSYCTLDNKKFDLSEVEQSLVDSEEKQVLIMLDGADEVQELLSVPDSSMIQEILAGNTLPQADVIVSSRPGSLPFLQHYSSSFYEIHGFDQASIEHYVQDFFKGTPEKGEKMMKELHSRPDLLGGAHIPMNLFIYCSVYDYGGLPPTMTECHKKFLCYVVKREYKKYGVPCQVDPSLSRLSPEVKDLFESLGALAYEGMMKNPPVFVLDESDIRRAFPTLPPEAVVEESIFKGLLVQHSCRVGYDVVNTFNFSHTTNHEFFVAWHISHLPEADQLQFVREYFSDPKFAVVVRFYSGLTGLSTPGVASFLCQSVSARFTSSVSSPVTSFSLPSLCSNDDPSLLYLFHSLYESQNSALAQNIVQHLNQSLVFHLFLTSHDTLAISYCMGKCAHLKKLSFSGVKLPPSSLPHVFTILKANSHLLSLDLPVEHLPSTDATALVSGTAVEKLYLKVRGTTLSALPVIFHSRTIKELRLNISSLSKDRDSGKEKQDLSHSVSENTTLRKLVLHGSSDSMAAVLHGVAASATIEDLEVQGLPSPDGGERDVAEALAKCVVNPKLRRVVMRFLPSSSVIKALHTRVVPLEEFLISSHLKKDEQAEILVGEINSLQEELTRLKIECSQLSLKNDSLLATVTTRDREIQRLSLERDNSTDLLQKVKYKEQECKDLKELLQEATREKQELADQLSEHVADNAATREKKEHFEKEREWWKADVAGLKDENATLREALSHDQQANFLMKLHEVIERVDKRISEDVQSSVKSVSEEIRKMTDQLPDTESKIESLQNENISLKHKLADKEREVKLQTKKMEDIMETVQAKKKEEEILVARVREVMEEQLLSMMKQLLAELKGPSQDVLPPSDTVKGEEDNVEKEKLRTQVEDLPKQLKDELISHRNKQDTEDSAIEQDLQLMEQQRTLNNSSQIIVNQAEGDDTTDQELLQKQVEHLQKKLDEKEEDLLQAQDLLQQLSQSKECIKALENILNNLVLEDRMADKVVSDVGNVCEAEDLGALAHEAELEKLCWIPFGIQTLTVGEEGGLIPLQPQTTEVYKDNDVITLEIPEGAVNTPVCDRLCIRYGVIIFGPFDLPEGYQLGSMAVYIHFNQEHAVKPVVLHLPHWSSKDGESGLKCVVAPHRLEEGEEKYKFKDVEEGDIQLREGCHLITIDGHCSLFADALKEETSLNYYATEHKRYDKNGACLDVVITHASPVWLEILQKYRCTVSRSVTFDFAHSQIEGSISPASGPGWTSWIDKNHVVQKDDVLFKTHGITSPGHLEGAVKRKAYPPFISCRTNYRKELRKKGQPTNAELLIEGAKGKEMKFLCTAYSYILQECDVPVGRNTSPLRQVSNTPTITAVLTDPPSSLRDSDKDFDTPPSTPPEEQVRNGHSTGSPTSDGGFPGVPSDVGIIGIVEKIRNWERLAGHLGVPLPKVEEFSERGTLGKSLAIQYWRDGLCQREFPITWDFLLKCVQKTSGSVIAEELKKCACENPTWTKTS